MTENRGVTPHAKKRRRMRERITMKMIVMTTQEIIGKMMIPTMTELIKKRVPTRAKADGSLLCYP